MHHSEQRCEMKETLQPDINSSQVIPSLLNLGLARSQIDHA